MSKPNWLILDPISGSGNGVINNSATVHSGRVARTGIVTVSGIGCDPVPTIQNCDIRSYRGDPQTITTDLTESQLQKLSNDSNHRYILTTIDDKWKLLYQNGQEVE